MLNMAVPFRLFVMVLICNLNPCNCSQTNISSAKNEMHSIAIGLQKASKVNEIALPSGYTRLKTESLSFEHYLQNLPLNTRDNKIYSFDGSVISNGGYHYAVIDLDIGTKDLQQCADAVMRLRAEYLYKQKNTAKFILISFPTENHDIISNLQMVIRLIESSENIWTISFHMRIVDRSGMKCCQ